ncbi:cytoplasmic linker protein 190 isoform X7 [Musca autumnalis]|uniref:cytoplasmic linker protein 190 isoform X7 n=1 Tax=Musca autumnalis TaxID=221902 RepID=UPI003CEE6EC6
MSDQNETTVAAGATGGAEASSSTTTSQPVPATPRSNATTPTSSVTGVTASRLKAPTNFSGSSSSVSKIGRPCSHSAPKTGPPPRDTSSMSRESDDNLSSINSQYTDHGAILTHDTEQFIIGQRVWVGGIRPGQIAYIGETHFAPGDWAGIVLDEPSGKNDGCVAGKRYFQCEPKRGIFSRLTRLTLAPLPGAQTPTSPLSKMSPDRSRTVSPTASIRSSFLRSPGKNGLTVGDRVIVSSGFGSRPGILRYLGETQFASGNWCGIELDEGTGKNDGSVDGVRYFECKPKYGVFVPIAKVSLSPSSKKSRLSRTGSRESLTSIGTMNSIATTNTSRLRLNAQDILREKQQHIEQLMIERDLDREDSQNQALQYQKNINELKTRIALLERQLTEERKKAEDLQFSIDEATFCGDELNAQTQVYKEKIHELETKIIELTSGKHVADESNDHLSEKLAEQSKVFETQISETQDELQRLQENIQYLKKQNETLQAELVEKDQSLEKFSLSECGIENLRKELAMVKEESEKERMQLQSDFALKLEEKSREIQNLQDQVTNLKSSVDSVESERANLEDECRILREECKSRDTQVTDVSAQLAKLSAELSIKTAECATLDELVKAQQIGSSEEKSKLEEKMLEITKLNQEVAALQETKNALESNLQKATDEIKKLAELQSSIESKLKDALAEDESKKTAMDGLENTMKDLRQECEKLVAENQQLQNQIKTLSSDLEKEKLAAESYATKASEMENLLTATNTNLASAQDTIAKLQNDREKVQQNNELTVAAKTQEITTLKEEIEKLQNKVTSLAGESSVVVQQLSAKITNLESQNKRLEEDLKNSNTTIEDQRLKSIQKDELIASKVSELKSTTTALESSTHILEKLRSEHEAVLNRKKELEEDLKKSEERHDQQQLELGDLKRKLESTNSKCDTLAQQNEVLQQEIITVRTTNTSVHNDVKKLNDEIQQKQNEIAALTSSANEERIQLTGQLEELQQKLSNSIKDFNDLKETLQKSKEDISKKSQHITELEEKTIKQELLLSDQQRQQENLQSKYDSLLKQNESLQADLTSLRTSTTDSNTELMKLSQDIANKQKALDELVDKSSTERAALESQLQASQQRIDGMCSQVEALTQELKNVTEESFSRYEQLKQAEEKCGKQELDMADLQRKLDSFVSKCENLEEQNKTLQSDLNTLRQGSAGSNAEIVRLTEELSQRQKQLQELADKTNNERLSVESQLQEARQSVESQQHEIETLRNQLKTLEIAKEEQAQNFEITKKEIEARTQAEIKEIKDVEGAKQKSIIESFEAQLKNSEQSKSSLDEAISSLQKQIQLLQDELLKSQLDFKAKEGDMQKQIAALKIEKDQLYSSLQKAQNDGSSAVSDLQQENTRLLQSIEKLTQDLKEKDTLMIKATSEAEQLRILQSNTKSELDLELQKLRNALELSSSECEHKTKLVEEDNKKIEELKSMIASLKTANEKISLTNAQLAEALEILEQEKCETAHIFEIFEMESDQNVEKLIEKLSHIKEELASTQQQLRTKEAVLKEKEENLATADLTLQQTQTSLDEAQSNVLQTTAQLNEMQQANEELKRLLAEMEEKLKEQKSFDQQLEEYKKIIDEMDETSTEKNVQLQQMQSQLTQLRQEQSKGVEREQILSTECATLQRKLEVLEMEKTKEIVALKQRISDLQSISNLKQNGTGDSSAQGDAENGDSAAQISFLNSIIADMQKKNDTLKAKIEALEALPTDYTKPHAFDLIAKRKPAPRVFCDICDEFDKHETEDCPLQASDDRPYTPPPRAERNNNEAKERKLPEPRKYCESCEVFGHEAGECDDECY